MSTASAPLEIGRVALTVNDLSTVRSFYESVLGLEHLGGVGGDGSPGHIARTVDEEHVALDIVVRTSRER